MTGSLPTTPQEWRERAITHYAESRALMAEYDRLVASRGNLANKSVDVQTAYQRAANETQAAIAAGIIADAMFNETLATFNDIETEYPL